jgi:hypothetical protein
MHAISRGGDRIYSQAHIYCQLSTSQFVDSDGNQVNEADPEAIETPSEMRIISDTENLDEIYLGNEMYKQKPLVNAQL